VNRPMRLALVLALNLTLVAALVIVGFAAGSLGVLAAGADYLADAAAICVSLLAIWLADRPPSRRRPRGYPKATAVAAMVNGGWLLVLSLLVIAGAIDRLATGVHEVHGLPVLVVSATAAVAMVIGALILGADADDTDGADEAGTLNMRAVLLDTVADAAAAAGVAATGAIILAARGLYWLDSTVALIIAAVIAYQAIRLLRRVGTVLRLSSLQTLVK
jgi:cobalt-zinc-cadmium efflux system protein